MKALVVSLRIDIYTNKEKINVKESLLGIGSKIWKFIGI